VGTDQDLESDAAAEYGPIDPVRRIELAGLLGDPRHPLLLEEERFILLLHEASSALKTYHSGVRHLEGLELLAYVHVSSCLKRALGQLRGGMLLLVQGLFEPAHGPTRSAVEGSLNVLYMLQEGTSRRVIQHQLCLLKKWRRNRQERESVGDPWADPDTEDVIDEYEQALRDLFPRSEQPKSGWPSARDLFVATSPEHGERLYLTLFDWLCSAVHQDSERTLQWQCTLLSGSSVETLSALMAQDAKEEARQARDVVHWGFGICCRALRQYGAYYGLPEVVSVADRGMVEFTDRGGFEPEALG
jgi:hypothetical protein